MRIQRFSIRNFRNFQSLDVELDNHAVFVGPNGVGKSNLLYALRLILDPSLPDALRQLRPEDFWDGVPRPLAVDARLEISVWLTDFEENDDQLSILAEHLVEPDPMVARLTYVFRAKPGATTPLTAGNFEFFVHGGNREDNRIGYEVRRRLPADVLHALRDAEGDLATWRRSPLRPLLERAWSKVPEVDKDALAASVENASTLLTTAKPLEDLRKSITETLAKRSDGGEATDIRFRIGPNDAETMIRVVRIMLDEGRRGIREASLGLTNVLFFTLKLLELGHLVEDRERDHTFVAIEEPEAHLHPHLQRQMFRGFLRLKPHLGAATEDALDALPTTILVTTHSPHLASIAPLKSLVLLRRVRDNTNPTATSTTVAVSMANATLEPEEERDLERYIEASRAELLFARGVILVEGEAEQYIVPKIATLRGKSLDPLGISVCSVGGTHFRSYVRLLSHLKVPFAVITDGDADKKWTGEARALTLLETIIGNVAFAQIPADQRLRAARDHGLFVGVSTLELDLLTAGRTRSVSQALKELAPTGTAATRAAGWLADPSTIDHVQMLEDVASIGKGRFAQRLASIMQPLKRGTDPRYIVDAIDYVANALAQ